MIKILKVFLIFILLSTLGCASSGLKKQGVNANGMTFIESSNGLPSAGQWRHGIDFYDINGDGHIDILSLPPRQASDEYRQPLIWYGNGGRDWSLSRLDVPSGAAYDYGSISVSDFDGDAIPDVALAIHAKGLKALKGTGGGRFIDYSKGLPEGKEFMTRALVTADFNNDGIADIASVSEAQFNKKDNPAPLGVWRCFSSAGAWRCGAIGEKERVLGLYADQLAVGDVNSDGNKDIAVASLVNARDLIIWLGDGKGGFNPFNKGLPPEEMTYLSVSLGDVNMDGRDDLAASIAGIGAGAFKGLKVFLSGDDSFKDISEDLPAGEVFTSVKLCDLDKNAGSELVAATGNGGVRVFSYMDSKWHDAMTAGLPEKGYFRIYNINCRDMNEDGYNDIVINYASGSDNSGGIRVFLNVPDKSRAAIKQRNSEVKR